MWRIYSLTITLLLSNCLSAADRPNIVWIVVDDMSCHFGYQGDPLTSTPNVDKLAKSGIVFSKAYATSPVCSTFRSAMITGMYQTAIGAHHHRSGRGEEKIYLPEPVRTIPELFHEAGYYTTISNTEATRFGKQDYNFEYDQSKLYDGFDPSKRQPGQPFFAQFQLQGGKHRHNISKYQKLRKELGPASVPREKVQLPPYYPDHPVVREDWAAYLDTVSYTDLEVGRIIKRLESNGDLKNTVIFFLTDHGISHIRGKQFLYEEGIKIPFVVWGPGIIPKSNDRTDLIAHIDLAATSLQLAGIPIPEWMQGRSLFGPDVQTREFVVSARDRCGETIDRIRSVRIGDFKYIRNFHPQRPYLQPSQYKDRKPFMPVVRQLYADGKLNDAQSLMFAKTRPEEELYHLSGDPWEVQNLAGDPNYQEVVAQCRGILANWILDSNDQGRFPEPARMYDSEMKDTLDNLNPVLLPQKKANIELHRAWKAEGK